MSLWFLKYSMLEFKNNLGWRNWFLGHIKIGLKKVVISAQVGLGGGWTQLLIWDEDKSMVRDQCTIPTYPTAVQA